MYNATHTLQNSEALTSEAFFTMARAKSKGGRKSTSKGKASGKQAGRPRSSAGRKTRQMADRSRRSLSRVTEPESYEDGQWAVRRRTKDGDEASKAFNRLRKDKKAPVHKGKPEWDSVSRNELLFALRELDSENCAHFLYEAMVKPSVKITQRELNGLKRRDKKKAAEKEDKRDEYVGLFLGKTDSHPSFVLEGVVAAPEGKDAIKERLKEMRRKGEKVKRKRSRGQIRR